MLCIILAYPDEVGIDVVRVGYTKLEEERHASGGIWGRYPCHAKQLTGREEEGEKEGGRELTWQHVLISVLLLSTRRNLCHGHHVGGDGLCEGVEYEWGWWGGAHMSHLCIILYNTTHYVHTLIPRTQHRVLLGSWGCTAVPPQWGGETAPAVYGH